MSWSFSYCGDVDGVIQALQAEAKIGQYGPFNKIEPIPVKIDICELLVKVLQCSVKLPVFRHVDSEIYRTGVLVKAASDRDCIFKVEIVPVNLRIGG